jgi:hypothetical protein
MPKRPKSRQDRNAKVGEAAPAYEKVDVADREELKHPGSGIGANRDNAIPPKGSPTQRRP